jgi:hypothetical protein
VYAGHPHGGLWVDAVRQMLAEGALAEERVRAEVALGHARPSLLVELGLEPGPNGDPAALRAYDAARGFVAHRRLLRRFAARKQAIRRLRCDQACARRPWLAPVYRWLLRLSERRDAAS